MNRRQRRALYKARTGNRGRLVLIFEGEQATDLCDQAAARKYVDAPNAKVIRAHRSGEIVEVHIKPHGDDTKRRSTAGGRSLTYEEVVAEQHLVTLKIWDGERFRRWTAQDGFNPRRFNPDRLAKDRREFAQMEKTAA